MCIQSQKNLGGSRRDASKSQLKNPTEGKMSFAIGSDSIIIDHSQVTKKIELFFKNGVLKIKKISSKTKATEELIIIVNNVSTTVHFNDLKKDSLISIDKNGTIILPA